MIEKHQWVLAMMGKGLRLVTMYLMGIVVAIPAAWSAPSQSSEADLIITHAKVISPPNVIEDATVVIKGNRIVYVGKDKPGIKATRRIDATNKSVLPGLIDAHVHLIFGPPSPDSDAAYDKWVSEKLPGNMQDLLAHGFTTILSVGDYWPQILRVRDKFDSGEIVGPRFMISGPVIVPVGGHITEHKVCSKSQFCVQHLVRQIASVEEARAFVRELAKAKVDGIKLAINDISENTHKPLGKFAPGVEQALIDEAHAQGLMVRAHAYPYHNAIDAIEKGVDALVHGPEIMGSEPSTRNIGDLLTVAKAHHVPMVSTIAPMTTYIDYNGVERYITTAYGDDLITPEMAKFFAEFRKQYANIKYLTDQGVDIAWGTDTWAQYRFSDGQKFELKEMLRTGLSPMQILATATVNAAKVLGKHQELGAIETGKLADLIVVAGDPLKNLDGFLDRVDVVVKDGIVVVEHERALP